ncbi:lipocalin family protein [Mucilaginibacter sp. dw_454]|uniref:lipocalin family protein n=1 Tax=Mucilaginibacter sp. dw_454 TaxID=2720079 RepID=UPI001BD51398|nr:lipocalin family protein [Mucilaginibacter sp. dw_454]
MKIFAFISLLWLTVVLPGNNKPVDKVDLNRYAGKWYSLYSIPTMFDKGTRETTTTYTLNKDGYYNVVTTAKKGEDNELHTYTSKLFPIAEDNNAQMKAQFIWPIKVDYWVIDVAPDYSYVVVGHPDHKFLFIMSRKPTLDKKIYEALVAKCKEMGYPVEKLTAQYHD